MVPIGTSTWAQSSSKPKLAAAPVLFERDISALDFCLYNGGVIHASRKIDLNFSTTTNKLQISIVGSPILFCPDC